jgi:antirestriction protein
MSCTTTKTHQNPPSVYVASLSDYNAGTLHGCWLDLSTLTTEEEIQEAIAAMLAQSPEAAKYADEEAEEWAFHDSQNCGNLSEFAPVVTLAAIAEDFEAVEREGLDWDLYLQWLAYSGEDWGNVEQFRDCYHGAYDEPEDYAAELIEELYRLSDIPELIRYHIDYAGIWRDLYLSGDCYEIHHDLKCHIFSNH